MSCRHDLANSTCRRCYPSTGTVDPGPEEDYEDNLEGPGAVTKEKYLEDRALKRAPGVVESSKLKLGVTISGADDAVDPRDLAALSAEYRHLDVEWGILLSQSRQGSPRYPSCRWVEKVCSLPDLRLAAHLCGDWAEQVSRAPLLLDPPWWVKFALRPSSGCKSVCRRVQINCYVFDQLEDLQLLASYEELWAKVHDLAPLEWVLQCRVPSLLEITVRAASRIPGGSVLFDISGGRGLSPSEWPAAPIGRCRVGYAGGITHDSVAVVVEKILAANDGRPGLDTWVDVESGVRDGLNRFDLGKVKRFLDQVCAIKEKTR